MPLYSYHCAECDKDTELLIGSGATPVCPACGRPENGALIFARGAARKDGRYRKGRAGTGGARGAF